MHILSPETDNYPSWISGREIMTIESILWSIWISFQVWRVKIQPDGYWGQLTRNLVGSIEVTIRSRIAKIVPNRNPRWPVRPPFWRSILNFPWTERRMTRNLIGSIQANCRSNIVKIVPLVKIYFKRLFLTRNLVGCIRVPCRKMAALLPSWKSIFFFFFFFSLSFFSLKRKAKWLEIWN